MNTAPYITIGMHGEIIHTPTDNLYVQHYSNGGASIIAKI